MEIIGIVALVAIAAIAMVTANSGHIGVIQDAIRTIGNIVGVTDDAGDEVDNNEADNE